MLIKRILSVLLIGPPVLLGIYFSNIQVFRVILLALCVLASFEWCNLANLESWWSKLLYAVFLIFCTVIFNAAKPEQALSLVLIWWALVCFWVVRFPRHEHIWGNRFFIAFLGLNFLSGFWYACAYLKEHYEIAALFYILFLVWLADSAAYFAGNAWGKHKLAPEVSPKKTWEGVYGAVVACIVYSLVFTYHWHQAWPTTLSLMGVSIACFILAVMGDLAVSMFKRHRKIKDSGWLIPGHGGLLDRLDSLLSAIPLFTLGLVLFDYKIF